MERMYVKRIVLKSMDTDIADCDSIPMISINVVNPRRKVTMITLASISQRKPEVRYSVYFELLAILRSIHNTLRMQDLVYCIYP